jgi:hypothetical protein
MVLLLLGDFIGGVSKRPRLEDYFILNLQRAESRPYFQTCSVCKLIIWLSSFSEDGQKDMRSKHGKYPAANYSEQSHL